MCIYESTCITVQLNFYAYRRYDGIYKVVRYYPDTGKSGFRVWRYVLRRDDPSSAPWTKEGKAKIASLGLKLLYPDGYLEAMKKIKPNTNKRSLPIKKDITVSKRDRSPPKKKFKQEIYKLEDELKNLIEEDKSNAKLWDECLIAVPNGKTSFLQHVSER